MTIDAETRLCAVIGNPIGHSLSPLIHNAAFRERKINYVYTAFQVEDLKGAMAGVRALGIRGLSVTIPHKIEILRYLDEVDPLAGDIGSVNTVLNDKGRLKGFNTDGTGALKALKDAGVDLKGARALILGSGGAARAVVFSLVYDGGLASLSVLGIIPDQIEGLVSDVRSRRKFEIEGGLMEPGKVRDRVGEADVLINCSPAGMFPRVEATPVDKGFLKKGLVVFDIVYNPLKTRLLREAEDAGCKTISGSEMFLNQAVLQFGMFTGMEPPVATMRSVLMSRLKG